MFIRSFTASVLFARCFRHEVFRLRDYHPILCAFPCTSAIYPLHPHGLIRFRSPLLTESRLISFPVGTEMFQFSTFAPHGLCIQPWVTGSACTVLLGFPIRRSSDQSLVGSSPRRIAASYVLHRLSMPRHPLYALSSLTTFVACPFCRAATSQAAIHSFFFKSCIDSYARLFSVKFFHFLFRKFFTFSLILCDCQSAVSKRPCGVLGYVPFGGVSVEGWNILLIRLL